MSMMNNNSTSSNIVTAINKVYEKNKDRLEYLVDSNYKDSWHFRYPISALLKSLIFLRIKKLKFTKNLSDYLKTHENTAVGLGFLKDENNKVMHPDRRTFGYF